MLKMILDPMGGILYVPVVLVHASRASILTYFLG